MKAALLQLSGLIASPFITMVILIGCTSSKTVEQSEHSGFLSDYSKLQPAKSLSGSPTLRWISPDLAKGQYDKVYLEQPVLFLGKGQEPTRQVSRETMDQIVAYLGNAERAILQRRLALASGPGPRTLRVRTAVTAVKAQTESLKPYEYIPIALAFAAASTATGTRDEDTWIYVEGEATDSQTGAPLIEFARKDPGPKLENENTQLTLQDVQPLLDKWSDEFYQQLKNYTKIP